MYRSLCALCLTLTAAPAIAQDAPLSFPTRSILALAQHAYLDRDGLHAALSEHLPVHVTSRAPTSTDPFLYTLTGAFGGEGATLRPGAIFACARYGLETRDLFAQHGHSAPETFALMDIARPRFDDVGIWPEGAVARLHCEFVWDDTRVVEIVALQEARAALAVFDVLAGPAPDAAGNDILYGADGYMIEGTGGVFDSVVLVHDARMTLTQGHQSFTFRSFLMGGGV